MARIGSVAAAPFVGDQFAALYLGETRVPTVPGPPTITSAQSQGQGSGDISFTAPADGGLTITGYNVYANGSLVNAGVPDLDSKLFDLEFLAGDDVQIAAVNAIGEGPLSNSVIAEDF